MNQIKYKMYDVGGELLETDELAPSPENGFSLDASEAVKVVFQVGRQLLSVSVSEWGTVKFINEPENWRN